MRTSNRNLMTALALVFLALPPALAQQQTAAQQAFLEGNAAYEKRENEKALAAYERAIALEPTNAEFRLGRARALARLARHAESVEECTKILQTNPNHIIALRDRGHYYINLHRAEDAIPDLARAEQLEKTDRDLYYHLALAYYIAGDFARAVPAWQRCLEQARDEDNAIACSAWLYPSLVRAGRAAEAKKLLERFTPEMRPRENTAYFDRLMLFKGVAKEEDVVKTMEAGGVSTPTVAYSIGVWHLLEGRSDRARDYFEKAANAEVKYAFGAVAAAAELKRMSR